MQLHSNTGIFYEMLAPNPSAQLVLGSQGSRHRKSDNLLKTPARIMQVLAHLCFVRWCAQPTAYLYVWSIVHGVIGGVCHRLKVDDTHFLGLPNPVSSGNSLLLILGVGVRVIHHHCVGCLQVRAPASGPDAQQEDEDLAVGCIEALDGNLPAAHAVQHAAAEKQIEPCIALAYRHT